MAIKQESIDKYIVDCESEILNTIITTPFVVDECVLNLDPDDFADARNRAIFAVVKELHDSAKPINKNIILDFMSNNEAYQFNNWRQYFEEIASAYSNDEDLKTNIEIVKNASIKRSLDRFAKEVIDTKIDFAKYNNQVFELQNKFLEIINSKKTSHLIEIQDVAKNYRDIVQRLREKKQDITGTEVGFRLIDQTTNGFQPGDLIILAARPGIGKTALALNFAAKAARIIKAAGKADKEKVVIFSLEMGKEQLCQRFVSMDTRIPSNNLRSGRLDDMQWDSVKVALENIESLPILIDDSSDVSIVDIQSKLKQIKNKYGIKLVIVDYLQLLKGPRVKGQQVNRQQEVSTISRMLKILARNIGAPIIALAQLSRKIEDRPDQKPMLSDLRESGALEQDADLVTFLHRHKDISEKEEDTGIKPAGPKPIVEQYYIDYIIAKHRNGETRSIPLVFKTRFGMFFELDTRKQ